MRFQLKFPSSAILFPSAFVLGGDTASISGGELQFDPLDADKDDYTQNCVGGAADPAAFTQGSSFVATLG
jgi:hypothetical protein